MLDLGKGDLGDIMGGHISLVYTSPSMGPLQISQYKTPALSHDTFLFVHWWPFESSLLRCWIWHIDILHYDYDGL